MPHDEAKLRGWRGPLSGCKTHGRCVRQRRQLPGVGGKGEPASEDGLAGGPKRPRSHPPWGAGGALVSCSFGNTTPSVQLEQAVAEAWGPELDRIGVETIDGGMQGYLIKAMDHAGGSKVHRRPRRPRRRSPAPSGVCCLASHG